MMQHVTFVIIVKFLYQVRHRWALPDKCPPFCFNIWFQQKLQNMRKHTVSALKFCFPISDHVRDTLKSKFPIVLSTMSPINAIKNLKQKTIPRLSVHNIKWKKRKTKKETNHVQPTKIAQKGPLTSHWFLQLPRQLLVAVMKHCSSSVL